MAGVKPVMASCVIPVSYGSKARPGTPTFLPARTWIPDRQLKTGGGSVRNDKGDYEALQGAEQLRY